MFGKLKQNFVLFFLIILLVFAFGFWLGKYQVICPACPPENVDFSLFWEVWRAIEEKYVDRDLNVQEMIYGAISGMIESLEDPYTVFLKPEEAKKLLESVEGIFEGIGVEIAIRKGQLQVVAPLEETPAQKAGLRPGDKILKVDGKSTANITVEEATNLIRGPRGTEVILTIYRDEWEGERDVKIIRKVIDIPTLKLEMLAEDNIAYLRIYHFSEKANYNFREAAMKILASPTQKIILDLRNNPGGYLPVAQSIAGWLLEKGQVVAIEDFGERRGQEKILAKGNAKLITYPIVVLINKGSASGSEILAGALRDNRGVKLIGETSFGKGSVQELTDLREGFSLKVSVARWLTPKGESITEKGLEPDIKVEMTEKDYEEGRDPQLDKAIEVIREMR